MESKNQESTNGGRVRGYVSFPGGDLKSQRRAKRRYRWRTFLFVFVFLVTTFAMLTGYRFVTDTEANQYYLFTVARHTCWVLGFIGEESFLEQKQMYRGRESEVRVALRAWDTGLQSSLVRAETVERQVDTEKPLTSWEVFRYKTLKQKEDFAYERRLLDMLEMPKGVSVNSPSQALDIAEERLERLQNASVRPGPHGLTKRAAQPVNVELPKIEAALDRLRQETPQTQADAQAFMAELNTNLIKIDQLRQVQREYVMKNIDRFQDKLNNMGPWVSFLARRSLSDKVVYLKKQIDELGHDPDINEMARARKKAFLTAELGRVERKIKQCEAEGNRRAITRTYAFPFVVVSDCGAIPSMSIFLAAVLAFPCVFWKRLVGAVVGVPILYGVNVARLCCLAYIGAMDESRQIFTFVHEYVWQGVYVIFVVAVWLLWVEILVKRNPSAIPSR